MKYFLTILLLSSFTCIRAQHNITLVVSDASKGPHDDIYIAGSFNNWKQNDESYKLKKENDGTYSVTLKNIQAGSLEYKFMHGTWDKVETTAAGEDVSNHELQVTGDYKLYLTVYGWKDGKPVEKKHTVSANVHIIDTAFYIPQLKRYRRIWIYLPAVYNQSKTTKFPVLYMHDGQNLFDEYTSGFGEWGVDECLDTLQQQTGKYAIVVGIDHGNDKRLTEYNPYDNARFGKGEGKEYADFIINTLKPFIDSRYRTMKDEKHTAVAGSSMGGLISHYIALNDSKVFGTAGIFSPSYWIAPEIYTNTAAQVRSVKDLHLYFYWGGKESDSLGYDMKKMFSIVSKNKQIKTNEHYDEAGHHNEAAWRKAFGEFYSWWGGRW